MKNVSNTDQNDGDARAVRHLASKQVKEAARQDRLKAALRDNLRRRKDVPAQGGDGGN